MIMVFDDTVIRKIQSLVINFIYFKTNKLNKTT